MVPQQLIDRYEKAKKALASLKDALELMQPYDKALKEKSTHEVEREYRAHRDSVIKRFEFTLDMVWKYLKFYLENRFGVVHNSPKPVMRECLKNNLISETEALRALDMINACNMTSHIYKEEIAEEIVSKIPDYYLLTQKMLDTLVPPENRLA